MYAAFWPVLPPPSQTHLQPLLPLLLRWQQPGVRSWHLAKQGHVALKSGQWEAGETGWKEAGEQLSPGGQGVARSRCRAQPCVRSAVRVHVQTAIREVADLAWDPEAFAH
eukprot:1159686-Pelagomonas_calceolata.AAC.2